MGSQCSPHAPEQVSEAFKHEWGWGWAIRPKEGFRTWQVKPNQIKASQETGQFRGVVRTKATRLPRILLSQGFIGYYKPST